jgi:hypothetical protein
MTISQFSLILLKTASLFSEINKNPRSISVKKFVSKMDSRRQELDLDCCFFKLL